jgi:transposase
LTIDRDVNAAINIKYEGERIKNIGLSKPEFKLAENGYVDDPNGSNTRTLKSTHSVKQEDGFVRAVNDINIK